MKFSVTRNMKVKLVDRTRTFSDVPESQWFKPYVDFSTARGLFNGILNGVGGNMLSPQGLAARAAVSTMLMRFVGVIL